MLSLIGIWGWPSRVLLCSPFPRLVTCKADLACFRGVSCVPHGEMELNFARGVPRYGLFVRLVFDTLAGRTLLAARHFVLEFVAPKPVILSEGSRSGRWERDREWRVV